MTIAIEQAALNLAVAVGLGAVIGFERQWNHRLAGLRTNTLVALGSASFVLFSLLAPGEGDPTRIAAQVVTGIGFLGGGVIFKEGLSVRGLNTAATLWCSAAVGAAAGAGLIAEAGLLTLFVIAGNTLLRPIVNSINRIPIDEESSEALYVVRLTTDPDKASEAREALVEALDAANYPVSDVATEDRGEDMTDVVATLVSTAIVPEELDEVVRRLEARDDVEHATWESSAKA